MGQLDTFSPSARADEYSSPLKKIEDLRCWWESFTPVNPMQSYIWNRACAEVFSEGELRVVTGGEDEPRAIAFLGRPRGARCFQPIGAELFEPVEFAYVDAASAGRLAEALFETRVPIVIGDMFADSLMLRCLQEVYRRRLVMRPLPGHPYIDLDESWSEPESHLNAGRRSDMRRARRRAEQLGVVHCEFVKPNATCIDDLIAEAFRVEAASWKGREGSALAVDPRVGAFYRLYAKAAAVHGILRIGLLRIGDCAVAMQLAIQQESCFWLLKMGFDEQFSRCSPGALLMAESLKYATQQGCSRYELMGHKEAWNQMWTQHVHASVALRLHPSGPGGLVTAAIDRSRSAAVKWVRDRYPR